MQMVLSNRRYVSHKKYLFSSGWLRRPSERQGWQRNLQSGWHCVLGNWLRLWLSRSLLPRRISCWMDHRHDHQQLNRRWPVNYNELLLPAVNVAHAERTCTCIAYRSTKHSMNDIWVKSIVVTRNKNLSTDKCVDRFPFFSALTTTTTTTTLSVFYELRLC